MKTRLLCCVLLRLFGCACDGGIRNMSDEWCERRPSQSWDQANLKQHDNTCATMVFIAPGGDLEQCP
jgi:hypothetical protein